MQWQIPLGKIAPGLVGDYGSDIRKAWEDAVLVQVGKTILDVVEPYVLSSIAAERRAFVGLSPSFQGSTRAFISVSAHRLPNIVMSQLADILSQEITTPPVAGRDSPHVSLRASMGPGCEPEGCVTVTLKGPNLPMNQGAVAAILEGVGYKKEEVKVVQEFWGKGKVELLGDHHTIVAFVAAPPNDIFLNLLPDSIVGCGGGSATISISVNSRRGVIGNPSAAKPSHPVAAPHPMEVDSPAPPCSQPTPTTPQPPACEASAGNSMLTPHPGDFYPPPPPPPRNSYPPPPPLPVQREQAPQKQHRQLLVTGPGQPPKQQEKKQVQGQQRRQEPRPVQQRPTQPPTTLPSQQPQQAPATQSQPHQQKKAPSSDLVTPPVQGGPPNSPPPSPHRRHHSPPPYLGALTNWLREEKEVDTVTASELVGKWNRANRSLVMCQQYKGQMMAAESWANIPKQLQISFTKFVEQQGVCMGSYGEGSDSEEDAPMSEGEKESDEGSQEVMRDASLPALREQRQRKKPGAWYTVEAQKKKAKTSPSTLRVRKCGPKKV